MTASVKAGTDNVLTFQTVILDMRTATQGTVHFCLHKGP